MRHAILSLLPMLVAGTLLAGCLPFGLGGNVDGRDLEFVDATYFELRGIDPATSIEYHRIELWIMPMEDPCTSYPALLDELADLRTQITDESLSAEDYCAQWEDAFEAATGIEGFWLGQMRLNALPRDESEDIETEYIFIDDASEAIPSGPHFDSTLAWYQPSTFEACAMEFSGNELYAPDVYGADGGKVVVNRYEEDTEVTITLEPAFPSGDGDLQGQAKAEFCPGADEWPMEFGLGL